ncbi:hypothetical protein CP8484711_1322B, partial [Chlamydia psittaci 84-8471/1]
LREFGAN